MLPPEKRFKTWDVYFRNRLINTICTVAEIKTSEEVKKGLVDHDHYHPGITVVRRT